MSSLPPRVRFLDLSVTDPAERNEIICAINTVLDHGRIVLGPEVAEFERRIAEFCGRKHCVGVGSGTDALLLALKAAGVGPGDEVITTPLSWLATTSAIIASGATPVLADIDETLNIDPDTVERLVTDRTRAILPVHFTGRIADMPKLLEIAQKCRLKVIEDGSQAFGAMLDGVPCGGFGDLACISLNAMKVLAALGDAGVILTDDAEVADRLRRLRHSGVVNREYCVEISHNCRLDTLQAAILLRRLDRLPANISRRRELAARYDRLLAGTIRTLPRDNRASEVYYTYTIRSPKRDALRDRLESVGIETRIQHPLTLCDQPAYRGIVRGDSPNAEVTVKEILCLPLHEKMTERDQDIVVSEVIDFFKSER